ncbi:MAG: DUF4178 domain-containing protein [Deltaproteobacteria bacterium]|nr:DUF4178 domain-containing protein [Deltaproteobacteria bacterium]
MAARSITCTNCGAPLEVHNPRAKICVCQFCGAQLDLTSPDYAFLGVVQRDPLIAPLQVGQIATDDDGTKWRILGQIRFEEDGFHWDEWLLQAEDGRSFWIQYDDGRFSFYTPRRLTEPVDPLECTGTFELGGKKHLCRDFGAASIQRIEGELTWKAAVGQTVRWLDAREVAMEWTERELEIFDVAPVSKGRIVQLFGMTRAELEAGCYLQEDGDDWDSDDDGEDVLDQLGVTPPVKAMIYLIIVAVIVAFTIMDECGGIGGYHRGGYSSGGYSFGK